MKRKGQKSVITRNYNLIRNKSESKTVDMKKKQGAKKITTEINIYFFPLKSKIKQKERITAGN